MTSVQPSPTSSAEHPVYAGIAAGYIAIFLGGIIAAVTAPLNLDKGSWLAAYLILVAGLAQLLLSHQSHLLFLPPRPTRAKWLQLACWFTGNLLVICGSLLSLPLIVDLGGIALLPALVIAVVHTRSAPIAWRAWVLRIFYSAVAISIPIGLVLSHVRAG